MIEYSLTYSKRRSIGVTIKGGKVLVRAPLKTSGHIIDEFVLKNSKWIYSKLERYRDLNERFKDFFCLRKFLYRGNILEPVYIDVKKPSIDGGAVRLPDNSEKNLQALVAGMYKRLAKEFLSERINYLSSASGLQYSQMRLTNAKTKWGSCSSDKLIRLNWHLILLSDKLVDYVIIHELCHTKHLNHSVNFWHEVSLYIPDYKSRRALLKECAMLTELYR